MLKENWRLISRIEKLGDALIIVLAFFLAYYGRSSLVYWNQEFDLGLPFTGRGLAPLKDYFILLVVALLTYLTTLHIMGSYGSMRLSSSFRLFKISTVSTIFAFLALAAAQFLLKLDLSRSFVALFCVLAGLMLTAERFLVLKSLRYWRRRGRNFRNVIICGVGEQARRVAREISESQELGIHIRGFVDLHVDRDCQNEAIETFKNSVRATTTLGAVRVIRGRNGLEAALQQYAVDEVIFTDVVDVMSRVEESIVICSEQGVRTTLVADLFSIGLVRSGISYFGGMPLIHFQTPPGDRWELAVKRALDVVVASILLILLSPLFLTIALILSFSGPVFYTQASGRL